MPTRATPSSTAVTAGTAPPARIAAMHRSSASRFAGDGRPRWEKIVDSKATTGSPGGERGGDLGRQLRLDHDTRSPSRTNRVTTSTWVVCGNVSTTAERSWR